MHICIGTHKYTHLHTGRDMHIYIDTHTETTDTNKHTRIHTILVFLSLLFLFYIPEAT